MVVSETFCVCVVTMEKVLINISGKTVIYVVFYSDFYVSFLGKIFIGFYLYRSMDFF